MLLLTPLSPIIVSHKMVFGVAASSNEAPSQLDTDVQDLSAAANESTMLANVHLAAAKLLGLEFDFKTSVDLAEKVAEITCELRMLLELIDNIHLSTSPGHYPRTSPSFRRLTNKLKLLMDPATGFFPASQLPTADALAHFWEVAKPDVSAFLEAR